MTIDVDTYNRIRRLYGRQMPQRRIASVLGTHNKSLVTAKGRDCPANDKGLSPGGPLCKR